MLKFKFNLIISAIFVITLCTCIDPYIPKLNGYSSSLVVQGLITNENIPYEVILSRTKQDALSMTEEVNDATVFVIDETGRQSTFKNIGNGKYRTDNSIFTGAVGKTYILDIVTSDGKEYKSDSCSMIPVPGIDSIYYEKEIGYTNNQSETHTGISIYCNSKAGNENNKYYRWEYDETWKFKVPNPQKYAYLNDSTILPLNFIKEFCWKEQKSSEILIDAVLPGAPDIITKERMGFITPDNTDRLTLQYSMLLKQYSLSRKDYQFWSDLKKVSENNGDIFGSQPFPLTGNIHNVNDPEERVLGCFQVSAVSQKRIYITFFELRDLNLPFYHYPCTRVEIAPADYCKGLRYCIPPTWDEIYVMWTNNNYNFVEPYYDSASGELSKLIFAPGLCADCEQSGTLVKPDFWIDLI